MGGSKEGWNNLSAAGLEEAMHVCVSRCIYLFFYIVTRGKILYSKSTEVFLEVFLLIWLSCLKCAWTSSPSPCQHLACRQPWEVNHLCIVRRRCPVSDSCPFCLAVCRYGKHVCPCLSLEHEPAWLCMRTVGEEKKISFFYTPEVFQPRALVIRLATDRLTRQKKASLLTCATFMYAQGHRVMSNPKQWLELSYIPS